MTDRTRPDYHDNRDVPHGEQTIYERYEKLLDRVRTLETQIAAEREKLHNIRQTLVESTFSDPPYEPWEYLEQLHEIMGVTS